MLRCDGIRENKKWKWEAGLGQKKWLHHITNLGRISSTFFTWDYTINTTTTSYDPYIQSFQLKTLEDVPSWSNKFICSVNKKNRKLLYLSNMHGGRQAGNS